jgi:L-malate glycosyltransferase
VTAAVHQFLPTFEPGAIGEHALKVQSALRARGLSSEIFAEYSKGGFEGQSFVHSDYGKAVKAADDDVLMYHMAIGSRVADWLNDVPSQRLVLAHHNITPVSYYEPWDPSSTYGMTWGRAQLEKLAPRTTLGAAMSEFNRRELESLHYSKTAVTPLLLDFSNFDHDVDVQVSEQLEQRKSRGGTNWLFVGWVAPHKCQHDIIRAFRIYRQLYDSNAHLYLVGRTGVEAYQQACEKLVSELGLTDAVTFTGRVTDGELGAYYAAADVLVCMSEHEGVGIPLLEAMHNEVPVVAYSAAAVPETVGNAGLLLANKKPALVAGAASRACEAKTRKTLVEAGRIRLSSFSLPAATSALYSAIDSLD